MRRMTVTPRSATYEEPTPHPTSGHPQSVAARQWIAGDARRDWKFFIGTMALVTAMLGLLQNQYWVPAGDSEVYVAVARSLVMGEGFQFNGQPVAMIPPGWPVALALVMKISPTFLALKLFTMGCMIGALAFSFWVARRFVSVEWTAFVIVLTASLSHVSQASIWLISEALFCLVTSASLLVAFHVRERYGTERGRQGWWHIALLCALCAGAVLVRWAGVLGMLPIAAILLQGERAWPRMNRLWVTCFVAGIVTLTTFLVLRHVLSGWEARESGPAELAEFSTGEDASVQEGKGIVADRLVGMQYNLISNSGMGGTTYSNRFAGWGRWFSWLYWQPFRAGMGDAWIDLGALVFGWIIIGLTFVAAGYGAARREWMWLAMLIYTWILAINWPNVNARYYVPIFFLLTIGTLRAADALRSFGPDFWRKTITTLLWMFLGSVALTNVAIWIVEVRVARSEDFYEEYEAGIHQTIISADRYLAQLPDLKDAQIAVTPSYINIGKKRQSQFALRATAMLTDHAVINVPRAKQWPPGTKLAWWCQHYGVKHYLHQNPISPWRVWHFRVPNAWQERLQGAPVDKLDMGWALYRVVPSVPAIPGVIDEIPPRLEPIDTPPSEHWPTRVPGL